MGFNINFILYYIFSYNIIIFINLQIHMHKTNAYAMVQFFQINNDLFLR